MGLIQADARSIPLADASVDCCVTSPPYWGLRDYGMAAQIGLEASPEAYVEALALGVFREVKRVLKPSGTLWVNIGDSYAGSRSYQVPDSKWGDVGNARGMTVSRRRDDAPCPRSDVLVAGCKPKDLVGVPWRVAFALQADGWYLRSDIIWAKPNPMPESVTDRPTKSHEYLFLLAKSEKYYYDAAAIAEPVSEAMRYETEQGYDGLGLKDYEAAGVQNPSSVKARVIAGARKKQDGHGRRYEGFNQRRADQLDMRNDAERQNSFDGRGFPCKHRQAEPNAAGHRIVDNVAAARAAGASHDAPFGMTRNKRTVWTIPTMPYAGAHFATMPEALVEPCILAGCPLGGLVLDPFIGSGTVGAVAERLGRRWVGLDLNPAYHELAKKRTAQRGLRFEAAI